MDHSEGLALREHLKESFRARLRKETPSSDEVTTSIDNSSAYQGQFFGPSEMFLSDRVIQLLGNKRPIDNNYKMPFIANNIFLLKHKENSTFKKLFRDEKSTFGREAASMKKRVLEINGKKEKKLKFLREARDYSFLSADQVPGPEVKALKITRPEDKAQNITRPEVKARKIIRAEVKPQNITRPEYKARKIIRPEDKARKIIRPEDKARNITRPEDKARNITRPEVKARNITRPEVKARKIIRPEVKTRNIARPEIKARNITRPENPEKRKILSKGLVERKAVVVSKQSRSGKEKSTSEMANNRARKRKQDEGRRHDDISKEGANAIGMIRKMFSYDPTKYRDDRDDDDRKMEASFRDIEKEERRSAKIAKMEDAEELRKLSIATA